MNRLMAIVAITVIMAPAIGRCVGAPVDSTPSTQAQTVLFEDPLDGKPVTGWRVPPDRFVDHPQWGKRCYVEAEKEGFPKVKPWVGDSSWGNYRLEVEMLCERVFVGLDVHVQEDGDHCNSFSFYVPDQGGDIVFESGAMWGPESMAWKHWPLSEERFNYKKGTWLTLRLDVGDTVINIYLDGQSEPLFTFYDQPFVRGGIRLITYMSGAAYYRNLKVTALAPGSVKPICPDVWGQARQQNVLRNWQVTEPQARDKAGSNPPTPSEAKALTWLPIKADRRGVINLAEQFDPKNNRVSVWAKTTLSVPETTRRKCWLTYTDHFKLWCNGALVFDGPPRGWNDPDRAKYGSCRLIPDQFEVDLPLQAGENQLLIQSQVKEPWGWAYWIRTE